MPLKKMTLSREPVTNSNPCVCVGGLMIPPHTHNYNVMLADSKKISYYIFRQVHQDTENRECATSELHLQPKEPNLYSSM